jgi:dipeptidase D
MPTLDTLSPAPLWRHFAALSAIPRPSKKEERAAAYVVESARALGLVVERDDVGNVLVKKPATKGMEDRRTVVLQSHLDMVCQKTPDSTHDFANDPIAAHIDGDVVRADHTTLGADDGIGVSAALAVLASTDIPHGPIEALFTIDEETGMTGANGLRPGFLSGDILLNLDSEDEGEICIGCAGGADLKARMTYTESAVTKGALAFSVDVGGLKGGHSGVDIHLGRANANKVLARVLFECAKEFALRVVRFQGGDLRNAIPRSASAVVVVPAKAAARFGARVDEVAREICAEFSAVDADLTIKTTTVKTPTKAMSGALSKKLLATLYASPHGVFAMVRDMPSVTETSTNLAIVDVQKGKLSITHMLRSSVDTKKRDVANMLTAVFSLLGCDVVTSGGYPGWTPNTRSPVLAVLRERYESRFKKPAKVTATHGGLECGIIRSVYPTMDAVSIGPTVRFPHSPDEHVDIQSVQKFWDFLTDVLAAVPKR